MNKKELRKDMHEKLADFNPEKRKEIEKQLHEYLFNSKLWKNAQVVGVTISGETEWDTRAIIERGWQDNKIVCVPKTKPQTKEMVFYAIDDFSQTEKGFFNLVEPLPEKAETVNKESIDLLIVPGLLYNKYGYRIGFGGGYYDRFLEDFHRSTVSLLHSSQLMEDIPLKPHDIPVQYLITEKGLFESRNG
ncbi:5-formyltetrahydrofolate cyclo-ligase [Atopococcus tabaci]|uniref:5-formyltetrahydrofolate cyclo-ligase n=1 Tax=Atopococcus tabaci TaxID=269774 RepID=UPI00240A9AC7|nr:5-formyltetrahydrofolate cyclo-ligase [Atopococcus tabaci]